MSVTHSQFRKKKYMDRETTETKTEREGESKYGKIVTLGEAGWQVYGNSLHNSCNSSVCLKAYKNKKLEEKNEL